MLESNPINVHSLSGSHAVCVAAQQKDVNFLLGNKEYLLIFSNIIRNVLGNLITTIPVSLYPKLCIVMLAARQWEVELSLFVWYEGKN